MAFPVVESVTSTSIDPTATAHLVAMPATVNSGDLLVALMSFVSATIATPSGWTLLGTTTNVVTLSRFYRIADGTEDGTTVDFVTSASTRMGAQVYRISTWHGTTPPEGGTAATGASTAPDPPTLTPSWGADDTLWLVIEGHTTNTTVTEPTNYTNPVISAYTGTGPRNISTARRALNATTEDPGAFTLTASRDWVAQTLAIRPAAAGGGATVTPAVDVVVTTLPTPTILAAAKLTPAVIPIVASLPTPSIAAAAKVTPAVIAVVVTLPTPTILAAVTVTPAVIPLAVVLPTPTIDVVGGPVTVTPAVIAAIAALPTPIVSIDAVVTPAGIALVVTVPNPGVTIPGLVTPATIPIIVALPSAGVTAGAITFWSRDPVGFVKIGAGDQPPWN